MIRMTLLVLSAQVLLAQSMILVPSEKPDGKARLPAFFISPAIALVDEAGKVRANGTEALTGYCASLGATAATPDQMRRANATGPHCARPLKPESDIREVIKQFPAKVTLHAKNLNDGRTFDLDGQSRVRTASTIKLPILIAAAQAVHEGKATWGEKLPLTAEDKVYGSGILREFSAGESFRLDDLATLMIVVSDNTATNLILDRIPADYVNEVMERYGCADTRCNRKILGDGKNLKPTPSGWSKFGQTADNKKYGIGVSSPRDMVRLLEMLNRGEIVSKTASARILDILGRQQLTDGIGRHLDGLKVQSKSGSLDALRADVGLVRGAKATLAIAITVDGMKESDYSPDNHGNILISRLTELLLVHLGPIE